MDRWLPTVVLLAASTLFIAVRPAAAQMPGAYGGRGLTVGAFSGVMDDRPNFQPSGRAFRLAHEGILGGRLGYGFRSGFFLEGEVLYSPMEIAYRATDPATELTERRNLEALFLTVGAGYGAFVSPRLQLFVRGGAGGVHWNAGSAGEMDVTLSIGGGARYFIARGLAVRTDLRMHAVPSALRDVRAGLRPDVASGNERLWLPQLSAGFALYPGGLGGR